MGRRTEDRAEPTARQRPAKYRVIYEHVRKGITTGQYVVGQRIPTEAELAAEFHASRVTVARALRELEQEGLLRRCRGAGSFVRRAESGPDSLLGLITGETPGILTTVCDHIVRFAQGEGFGILVGKWPISEPDEIVHRAQELGKQYISRELAGVFFTPMYVPGDQMPVNVQIAEAFCEAGIPVVLLDRDVYDYPRRSQFDLVGIDNVEAGFLLTRHLLSLGHQRVDFIASGSTASTVTARIAGYREALLQEGIAPDPAWIHRGDTEDSDYVRELVKDRDAKAYVCANDLEAARMLRNLAELGRSVPGDVALVGVNDDPYAALLDVPLTTLRQPSRELGAAAASLMSLRLKDPHRGAREIRLSCELVVRESCGTAQCPRTAPVAG